MSKKQIQELSWTPIRRGQLYCAPACGAQCTIFQFDHAGILANQTAQRLGKDWEPHLNENLGWWPSVYHVGKCWQVSIREYQGEVSFTAFLGDGNGPGGKWCESADTPEEAIEKVRKAARADLKKLQKMIDVGLVESASLYGTGT